MKKTITSLLALALIAFSMSLVSAKQILPSVFSESEKYKLALRGSLGLTNDYNHVLSLSENHEIDSDLELLLNIPLTKEEEAFLTLKANVDQILEQVTLLLDQYPEFNGGTQIDGNTIIVYLSGEKDNEELIKQIKSIDTDNNVMIKQVKYSLQELNQIKEELMAQMTKGSTALSYIDIVNNQIVLISADISTKDISKAYENVDKEMIVVKEAKITLKDQAAIGIGTTIYENSLARGCTVGIYGKVGTATVGVTAGHCGPTNSTTTSVKKSTDNTTVGTWNKRTSGNSTSDSGRFTLNSSTTASTSVVGVPLGQTATSSEHTIGLSLGTVVTRSDGIPTTNGNIQANYVQIAVNVNGYNTLSDMIITSNTATSGGDSGSIVYRSVYNSSKSRYEAKAYGIHKGLIELAYSNGTNESYGVYSKINSVKAGLGIDSYLLEP